MISLPSYSMQNNVCFYGSRSNLFDVYINSIINSMDADIMERYVFDKLSEDYSVYNKQELINHIIEVHGEQHYEFSAFFHGTKLNFIKHKKRDKDKKQWCFFQKLF
ncbi:MAG: hypothetical protein EBW42_12500 [Rhodobacterales bacterium]|nr:hypothetical protein [Rhodobacterales bacterium]